MKQTTRFILLLTALACSGCGGFSSTSTSDFTIERYTPEYASGFALHGTPRHASTLLTIRNPWQGAQNIQQQIFFARDEEPTPKNFTGQIVRIPARRIVCMSSSHIAMFDALGEVRRIVGVSGLDYISNTHINEHKRCGEVRDVGYDTNLNFELLVAIQPDVVLLYGVTGENTAITGKLTELKIPYIYIGDYVEESPLGKAEWLMVMAEMCDCTSRGEEVFSGIRDRYNTLKAEIARQEDGKHPTVMLNTPYRDTWFMPSSRSYMVQLIRDAGGRYIYTKNDSGSSVPVDIEEAYALAHNADLWLNLGQLTSIGELKSQNPKFAALPVVHAGRIYNNNRRHTPAGGSDFWESGIVCPDKILADLAGIFRGDDAELYYYQRLQ